MRFENFIACHLLKSIHLWEDLGIGKHDLYFIRNKDQKEVDFLKELLKTAVIIN